MTDTIFHTILVVLPVAYTLLTVGYAKLFQRQRSPLADRSRALLIVTLGTHTLAMAIQGVVVGGCPMGRFPEFLSLLAVSIATIYLILEIRVGERSTGVFTMALVLVIQLLATVSILVFDGPGSYPKGMWESLHVFAAIVGYSAVLVSSQYGLLYLFLYTAIKQGNFGKYYRNIPSLDVLNRLNYGAAALGFFGLSVTLGVGVVMWQRGDASISLAQPTVLMTVILWGLFGGSVGAHKLLSIGGKKLAYSTLLGFLIVVGFIIGISLSSEFHG